MTSLLIVTVLLVALGLVAGRKTVLRVFSALGAQLNKLGRMVWGYDPVAVYQKQVDDATEEIKCGKAGLAEYLGKVNEMQRRVDTAKREIAVLQTRAEGYVAQNNKERALQCLTERKALEAKLAENEGILTSYQGRYQNNKNKVQYAQQKIEEAKRKAQQLKVELRMSQAEAELAKLDNSLQAGGLDGLSETEEEIQRQIDANRAVAQVNQDLGNTGMLDYQAEQSRRKVEADKELAELKAKMGLTTRNGA